MPSIESHTDQISRDFEKFSESERRIADFEMQFRLAWRIFGGPGKDINEIAISEWVEKDGGMSKRFRELLVEHPAAEFLKRFMVYGKGEFTGAAFKSRVLSHEPGTFEQEQVLDEIEQLLRDEVPNSPS